MESLNTQICIGNYNTVGSVYQSGGSFKIEVPQVSVMIPKPLSYEFRVVEHVDETGSIRKVGLQYSVHEHDSYGVRQLRQGWTDVQRIQQPYAE